jgi:hypothetical protein
MNKHIDHHTHNTSKKRETVNIKSKNDGKHLRNKKSLT